MSVYTIRNKFLDPYDPYWICRTLSLKLGTLMILLGFCNAFLKAPQMPVEFMLATFIGTAASEILPARTRAKKVLILFAIIFLLSTSGMLFGLFSYFRFGSFFLVMAFTYLALRFMAFNAKAAVLPSLMILWGILQLDGGATTDLNAIANSYLYYFEFGLMGALTILFFPDFTLNTVKSAVIRILESDVDRIGSDKPSSSDTPCLSALKVIRTKLPLLPESYKALYETIIDFQHKFTQLSTLNAQEQQLVKAVLSALIKSIGTDETYPLACELLAKVQEQNNAAYLALKKLIDGYNLCKA